MDRAKDGAEVAFTEWASDGSIRRPSFQGLRDDKNPKEVVREEPVIRALAGLTKHKRAVASNKSLRPRD